MRLLEVNLWSSDQVFNVDHNIKYVPKPEELRQVKTTPPKELSAPMFKVDHEHSYTGYLWAKSFHRMSRLVSFKGSIFLISTN